MLTLIDKRYIDDGINKIILIFEFAD